MDRENQCRKHDQLLGAIAAVAAAMVLGWLLFAITGCSGKQPQTSSTAATSGTTAAQPVTQSTTAASQTVTPTTAPVTIPTTVPPETNPVPQKLVHHVTPNHFTAEDFTYDEDGYVSCTAATYWLGVDVSSHQKDIDWAKVADAGIRFAMVRIAYRGWGSAGVLRADSRAQRNLDSASAEGLQVGVYIYSQAITVEEAEEEARFVLQLLDGRVLDLPVVFDWEQPGVEEARTNHMDIPTLNACAMAFCRIIEDAGYKPMVYFNQKQAWYMYDLTALQKAGYEFWLAMYEDAMTAAYHVPMWQYTNQGKVPGIKGKVDIDLYFPDL